MIVCKGRPNADTKFLQRSPLRPAACSWANGLCCCEVLRDYHGSDKEPGSASSQPERDEYLQALQSFVETGSKAKPKRKSNPLATSILFLRSLNAQLRHGSGGSVGFHSFMVRNPVRALVAGESYFHRKAEELPQAFTKLGQKRRLCIADALFEERATKKTRFALQLIEDPAHRLHLVMDRGPGTWTSMFMLFALNPIAGSYSPDLPHKAYGDSGNAVTSCGLALLRCGLVFAVNFFSGPWRGSGFFRQAQGVWKRFREQASLQDPYFQFWASELFLETGLPETQFGTAEGMQSSFQALCRCHALETRGERVKLSRWWSLCDRLEEFLPHWYSVACTVTLLGLERGTFANMDEVVAASAGHLRSDEAREVKYKKGEEEEDQERKLRTWGEVHSSLRGVLST